MSKEQSNAAQDGPVTTKEVLMAQAIVAQQAEIAELRAHVDRLTGMRFSDRMHAALVSRAENAEAECLEQCRLLGMSGEREARLLAERDSLKADAERWHEVKQHFVHERCGPNVGWTIGNLVLQGDSPTDAIDAAIAARRGI